MNYNVEWMREEIRNALLVAPRTRGQLDGHENVGCSDARFTKKSYRDITNDDGTKIAAVAAEVVRTLACKTFKQSPMPLPPQAFQHARLVKAMHTAPEHVSDWLRYCYSEGAQLPTRELLQTLLDHFNEQEAKKLAAKSQELIKHLALLACQQKRIEINSGQGLLTQTRIATLCGKTNSAWENAWSKRWKRLLSILDSFDKEGLDHVYQCRQRTRTAGKHAVLPMQSVLQARGRAALSTRVALQQSAQ